MTTTGSSNFSTVQSTGIPFVVEARNVACLCPNCLFGDTCACPNNHYSGTWTRYDLHTGKNVTDPEFCNKHSCANEDCKEGSDIESSLHLLSVSSNNRSYPTSPSIISMVNENSDPDFCEHTDVCVQQDLDTRIHMCPNFGALTDLFSLEEPFDPIDYTVVKQELQESYDSILMLYSTNHEMDQKVIIQCRFSGMAIASLEPWPLQ